MNAYHSKVKAEEKRRRLVERREKLRRLLEGEKEAMEVCVHTFLTRIRKKGCNNSLCVHIWNTHKGVTNMEIILMTVHSRVSHDAIPAGLSSKSLYHDCIEDCYVNVPYIHVPLCVWSCPKPYRKSWKRSHVTSSPTWRKGTYVHIYVTF